MPKESNFNTVLGEMGAQRAVRRLVTKALRVALSNLPPNARSLAVEQIESKLREQQGELMYAAPQEIPAQDQAEMNVAFQNEFRALITETIELLNLQHPKGGG